MERVRLCVDLTTFYKQLTHYNFFPSSNPFNYFTQGVVCTEVEVDVLSGNHKTLRSDVVVDVGSSINPMIDIGQIEGAFTQGAGWSTIEETIYSCDDHTWVRPRGAMFTTGPGTYKIPVCADNSCVCFLIFFFAILRPSTMFQRSLTCHSCQTRIIRLPSTAVRPLANPRFSSEPRYV